MKLENSNNNELKKFYFQENINNNDLDKLSYDKKLLLQKHPSIKGLMESNYVNSDYYNQFNEINNNNILYNQNNYPNNNLCININSIDHKISDNEFLYFQNEPEKKEKNYVKSKFQINQIKYLNNNKKLDDNFLKIDNEINTAIKNGENDEQIVERIKKNHKIKK